MMHRNIIVALCCLSLCVACKGQNARDILGLGKKSPDEFRVVSRPPLALPQDFTLRPPQEGEETLGLPEADRMARAVVTGEELPSSPSYNYNRKMGPADTAVGVVGSYGLKTHADEGFLANIGASKADPNIREVLGEAQEKAESKYLFDWGDSKDETEVLVDAKAEKERLEQAKAEGKEITEGETPIIEKKEKGLLEGLLN